MSQLYFYSLRTSFVIAGSLVAIMKSTSKEILISKYCSELIALKKMKFKVNCSSTVRRNEAFSPGK